MTSKLHLLMGPTPHPPLHLSSPTLCLFLKKTMWQISHGIISFSEQIQSYFWLANTQVINAQCLLPGCGSQDGPTGTAFRLHYNSDPSYSAFSQ